MKLAVLQVSNNFASWPAIIYQIPKFPLVPKENQEPEAILTQKSPAKRRGRKKKNPVEDDEPTNDNDQQNVSPATKTTPKSNAKCKAAAPASKTTAKRKRKVSAGNDDTIQEPAAVNEGVNSDVDIQEQAAAAKLRLMNFWN